MVVQVAEQVSWDFWVGLRTHQAPSELHLLTPHGNPLEWTRLWFPLQRGNRYREVGWLAQGHTALLTQRMQRAPCSLKRWYCFPALSLTAECLSVSASFPIKWGSQYSHDKWAQRWCAGMRRGASQQMVIFPHEQTSADEKTTAQRGQVTCQMPASQWVARSEKAFLAGSGRFRKLSQQLSPAVRNLLLSTESS